jgi:hypothetical protein
MTCRFFAALAVLLGLLLASVASMAQEKSPKSTIDDVVNSASMWCIASLLIRVT